MKEERGGTPEIVKINHKAAVGITFSSPVSPSLWSVQFNIPEFGWSNSEMGWQEYECVERK
jgi:hypothetical protein